MTTTETTPITRIVDGTEVPAAGIYALDASHSHVGFSVRHLMVSKTQGRFADVAGTVTHRRGPARSPPSRSTIPVASIDTRDETRDGHLRSRRLLRRRATTRRITLPLHQGHRRPATAAGPSRASSPSAASPAPCRSTSPSRAAPTTRGAASRIGFTAQRRARPRGLRAHLEPGPRDRRRAGRQAGQDRDRGRGRPPVGRPSSPDLWIGGGEIHLQFTGCSPSGPQARFPRLRNRARGRGVTRTGLVAVASRLWWAGRLLWGPLRPFPGNAPRPCTGSLAKKIPDPLTRL